MIEFDKCAAVSGVAVSGVAVSGAAVSGAMVSGAAVSGAYRVRRLQLRERAARALLLSIAISRLSMSTTAART